MILGENVPTVLNQIMEPFFSNPNRRDMVRRLLLKGMKEQKRILRGAIGPSCKVLDLGCGTGEFCGAIDRDKYYGVDVDVSGIKAAKKMHPGYRFSSIKGVADINGKYDIVAMIDTVHHLSRREFNAILAATHDRLLVRGGKLLIIDAVHPKEQRKWLGSFTFAHDRGNFQRTRKQVASELAGFFRISRYKVFQESILTFYLIIAQPAKQQAKV